MTDPADKPAAESGNRRCPDRPGAFLALPITLFVAVMFDTFPETRWLASLTGVSGAEVEVEHSG